MLALVARRPANLSSIAARRFQRGAIGSVRTFGIADQLQHKEKVEEDLFIRDREKPFFETQRRKMETQARQQEQQVFDETVRPVMQEVQEMLKDTDDSIGEEGLQALAEWKLNLSNDKETRDLLWG